MIHVAPSQLDTAYIISLNMHLSSLHTHGSQAISGRNHMYPIVQIYY